MRIQLPLAHNRRKARIEIIPLIDIVFFLLATFVMVSLSMVKNQGISVRLPSAATSAVEDRKSQATVTLAQDGRIFLNSDSVDIDGLKNRLALMKATDADLKVFINADEQAYIGSAIGVMDAIRSAGIAKIAFQTKNK